MTGGRRFKVGCVPYVNGYPLVDLFCRLGDRSPVEVVFEIPSKQPAMLNAGEIDAMLVSSVDALLQPGRNCVPEVCVGSDGPVASVRLFSRVDPAQIETLALDASSMTSNKLAQVVLAEMYGVVPKVAAMPPHLETMLEQCDACVLIGDIGMMANADGLRVLDLGGSWTTLTGLPFVWALWVGNSNLQSELSFWLNRAGQLACAMRGPKQLPDWLERLALDPQDRTAGSGWSQDTSDALLERMSRESARRSGMSGERCLEYFRRNVRYELDGPAMSGLRLFGELIVQHRLADRVYHPHIVSPALLDERADSILGFTAL